MNVPFVDLQWQEEQIRASRERRFKEVIDNTAFVLGPDVETFETNFASYCGVAHAVGVANGTDALILAFRSLGIGAGDEVITIPTTFMASVSTIMHAGATPVFVDINPATRNFDIAKLESAITPHTKAILAVHLYGEMADMDAIEAIAKKHNIHIIEDAAQAHGATYKGKTAGSFGSVAAFSFYPGKNLGAYGDAGAVVTNDADTAETLRKLRNHGGSKKYEHALLGYNSRLDTLMAVVLDEKLKHLDSWNAMRRDVADQYREGLDSVSGLRLPPRLPDTNPVYHLFVVELLEGEREACMSFLKEHGVASGIHYPDVLHLLPPLAAYGYTRGDFPVSEEFVDRIISLPMFPGMSAEQVGHVIATVKQFYEA